MVSWILVGILVVLVVYFLKYRHMQHRIFTILIVVVILFFYITTSMVLSASNIDIKTFEGIVDAGKVYTGWIITVAGNVKNTIGHVINMDWKNITVEEE